MAKKRQFAGGSKPRRFFDRKITESGHSRTLAVSKVIPDSWLFVRVWKIKETDKKVILHIEKLYGMEEDAQAPSNSQTGKQVA